MDKYKVRITDVITTEYSDFLSFCSESGKVFISELTNVDFVAFRTRSGQSRDYINAIKEKLDNPVDISDYSTDTDATEHNNDRQEYSDDTGFEDEPINVNEDNSINDVTLSNKDADIATISRTDENRIDSRIKIVDCTDQADSDSDLSHNVTPNTPIEDEAKPSKQTMSPDLNALYSSADRSDTLASIFDVDPSLFEDMSISQLDLSVRATNCLNRAKIKTVAELLSKTTEELYKVRNMGSKSVNEILQKVKGYVYNPPNIDISPFSANLKPSVEREHVELNPIFKAAIEALLMGDEYTTEGLNENQIQHLEKLAEAAQIVGEEICLEAYLNRAYGAQICKVMSEFAAPYIKFQNARINATKSVNELSDFMKSRKVRPFIDTYCIEHERNLIQLKSLCDDNTTIAQIPLLFDKFRCDEDLDGLIEETRKLFKWLDFDVRELIAEIIENISTKLSSKSERPSEVIAQRLAGKTLEEVGKQIGVTRERVRQIEIKAYRSFEHAYSRQPYDLIMLVYALRDGDGVLYFDELKEVLGEDFASIVWAYEKHSSSHKTHYYSKPLNAIVVRTTVNEKMGEKKLVSIIDKLLADLPDIIEDANIDVVLSELAEENSVPPEIMIKTFNSRYKKANNFYYKGRLTVVYMCEYVLKQRFPGGFKIADEFEAERFRQFLFDLFGEVTKTITNRALDARVSDIGVLCDRGKYIHPDFLQVDQSVIDSVNDYIEQSPRSVLQYGEILDALKDVFEGTQITNRYLLQGALKKYGCRFSTGRDFVKKTQSVTFVDELESFVEERGIVHKSEIFAAFTSLGEAGLGQVVARSANVFNIDNGYYIHADQFDIQPEDYEMLRGYLNEACKEIPVNIRSVYDTVAEKFPEFMYRNDFTDRNKLFAALNYMFREEFNFSRPYVAKLGISDISNRSVILQHIEDYDSIGVEELIDICEENSINYVSTANLCQSIAPDYVRVSKTTMMRRELTGITDEVVEKANDIIRDLLEVDEYIVGAKVHDFLWYPQIDVEWNAFLLESVLVISKKLNVINMVGDPLKRPNAIYVSDKFKKDTFDSFLIKILTDEVHKGTFTSKVDMRNWLMDEGMIDGKLPNFLESAKYFYVDATGVHCTGE